MLYKRASGLSRQLTREMITFSQKAYAQERGARQAEQPPLSWTWGTAPAGRRSKLRQTQVLLCPLIVPPTLFYPATRCVGALVQICKGRKIHLYGESKRSTHDHQTHLPKCTHQRDLVGISHPALSHSASALRSIAIGHFFNGQALETITKPTKLELTPTFFFPPHSPSDIVLPRSTTCADSGANLQGPENSFVWGIEEIDSRPPNSSPEMHFPTKLRQNFNSWATTTQKVNHHHPSRPPKHLAVAVAAPLPPLHTHHEGCTQQPKYRDVRLVETIRLVYLFFACDVCGVLQT